MTPAYSLSQAEQLERDSKFENAVLAYAGILARNPSNARAQQALESLRSRLREQREPSDDTKAELEAALASGRHFDAAESCGALLRTFRESHFLWDFLGRCHLSAGHLDNAATCLNKACGLDPKSAGTYAAMGRVQMARGEQKNATALFHKALGLDPECLPALRSLAEALPLEGRTLEAAETLRKAVSLAPQDAGLHFTLASLLHRLGAFDQAKEHYSRAASLDASQTEALYQLGLLLKAEGKFAEALPCFDRILQTSPANDPARTQRLHVLAELNDWRWQVEYADHRRLLGLRGSGCDPRALMLLEDNPDLFRIRAQAFASEFFPATEQSAIPPAPQRPARLRIGYFFTGTEARGVLDQHGAMLAIHDRTRFEAYAYCIGTAPDSEAANDLREAVSRFRHVKEGSSDKLSRIAGADQLDIAVDLSGFAAGSRPHAFSSRLAPLHMAIPGYPGTMGTAAFDYLISDSFVCPPGSERFYNEHLLRLPDSCMATAPGLAGIAPAADRMAHDLPAEGFVFCNFGTSAKITPQAFEIWMRLLKEASGSVLWLARNGDHAMSNLRRAAAAQGVDPDRLVFAPPVSKAEHLARLQLADLFLDTFISNAGTVARAALAAGLPVLTLPGQQFAARTGASLLRAAGLPELIAASAEEYEAKAAELAADPDAHCALRTKLQQLQQNAPLFDTKRFTRRIEEAYDLAFRRYIRGLAPDHLNVT